MLSDNDHPGIFTFLLGLIVVVLVAVGLSSLANVKFSIASSSPKSIGPELQANQEEIEHLTGSLSTQTPRLAQAEARSQAALSTRTALRGKLADQTTQLTALAAEITALQQAIPDLTDEFRRYRANYRTVVWERAVGESLGTLTVRGAREYRQAVIKRVTEVGLEISHEQGIARIHAPDLDPALQDRFQWNDEERRQQLEAELAQERAIIREGQPAAPPKPAAKPGPPPAVPTAQSPAPTPEPLKVKQLRAAVEQARFKVSRLNSQLSDARAAMAIGQTAVPGSLETWRSRVNRLETSLAAANSELAIAQANLTAVAPAAAVPIPMP